VPSATPIDAETTTATAASNTNRATAKVDPSFTLINSSVIIGDNDSGNGRARKCNF